MFKRSEWVNDCLLIENLLFKDDRGIFSEIFKLVPESFKVKQVNYSYSHKGVLRGLHKTPYAKLVTCVQGKVFDVCLDLRKDSETYKQHQSIILDSKELNQIYIPPNCGHGFLAYEDSLLIYMLDDRYDPNTDRTYCYNDYGIQWPFKPKIISNKDSKACL
jgi:dTDP-4-dehydrorhamnose 3,5-epimerase